MSNGVRYNEICDRFLLYHTSARSEHPWLLQVYTIARSIEKVAHACLDSFNYVIVILENHREFGITVLPTAPVFMA
jgi:hypothetical protein